MLWFERQVVGALLADVEPAHRPAIESYVDGALRALPEHVRLGVAAESVALTGWATVDRLVRRDGPAGPRLKPLESSPLLPVRQYVRLFRTLVTMARYEQPEVAT